ncbi:MAG: hypothetical protein K2L06_02115 [Alistipes sp.]|nr:hypothetical protein [Alistipes sp.]
MTNYEDLIKNWGKCAHLHLTTVGGDPEAMHRYYTERFNRAMKLRYLRRMRPLYLRMVNIEDHTRVYGRPGYRYVSDIVSPSIHLLCEICRPSPVEVVAKKKLTPYQVTRCFDWPIRYESIDHRTVRIITEMHPLTVVNGILQDHPDGIEHFQIGLETTLYMTPHIDPDDYFRRDEMPFKYKRYTRFQPITFKHE